MLPLDLFQYNLKAQLSEDVFYEELALMSMDYPQACPYQLCIKIAQKYQLDPTYSKAPKNPLPNPVLLCSEDLVPAIKTIIHKQLAAKPFKVAAFKPFFNLDHLDAHNKIWSLLVMLVHDNWLQSDDYYVTFHL